MTADWMMAGAWLAHTAVGGGVLLLLASVLAARTGQPARRQRLGEWAVAAALVLAVLNWAPKWLAVPVGAAAVPGAPEPVTSPGPAEVLVVATGLAPDQASRGREPPEDEVTPPSTPVPPEDEVTPRSMPVPPGADAPGSPTAWAGSPALLVGLYFLGAAVFAGRWLLGHVALWRLTRTAQTAPAAVARLFAQTAAGMRRRPRLLVSARLRVPVSFGLLRPTVGLPVSLCRPEAATQLRWVLAHELTHLERRDARASLLFGLAQAVYFYLPWFWWLRRQVRLCQEYVADAAVAAEAPADEYAQFLLGLTTAPAGPAGATGVRGNSSDLFRRITMLLHQPVRVERRCPRLWSLASGVGLVALAVLAAGVGLRGAVAPVATAAAADDPGVPDQPKDKLDQGERRQEQPGGEEPRRAPPVALPPAPGLEALRQALDGLKRSTDAAERDRLAAEAERALRQAARAREQLLMYKDLLRAAEEQRARQGLAFFDQAYDAPGQPLRVPDRARLGVEVERPSLVLVEQLGLAENEGLVVQDVRPGSPAAAVGLHKTDVLVELGGKRVSNDVAAFVRAVAALPAKTPVDLVVIRKGKKETLRGLRLPGEVKTSFTPVYVTPKIQWAVPGGPDSPRNAGVMTTLFRTDDRFTARHQEGSLIITLTGKVAEGKGTVGRIHVQDGAECKSYARLEDVPERYRDKVKYLAEMAEKAGGKVEIKTMRQSRLSPGTPTIVDEALDYGQQPRPQLLPPPEPPRGPGAPANPPALRK